MAYEIINFNGEPKTLAMLCKLLNNGAIFIIKTDTQIGLLSLNEKAIYETKKRPITKFLISLLPVYYEFKSLTKMQAEFLNTFWPGQMTAIIKGFSYRKTDTIYLNMIINQLNKPIFCSSANVSGAKSPINLDEAIAQLDNSKYKIYVIETNEKLYSDKNIASTIVNLDTWKILRKGCKYEEIKQFFIKNNIYII